MMLFFTLILSSWAAVSIGAAANLCSCYTFHTRKKDWKSSKEHCQNNGGNLVTMETEEEYQFINKTIQSRNDGENEWHIGLIRRTGEWKWLSNHSLTIDKWQPREPNNDGLACVVMAKNWPPGHYGLFRDLRCDIHEMFICEYKTGLGVCAGRGRHGAIWCSRPDATKTTMTVSSPTTSTTSGPHYINSVSTSFLITLTLFHFYSAYRLYYY